MSRHSKKENGSSPFIDKTFVTSEKYSLSLQDFVVIKNSNTYSI